MREDDGMKLHRSKLWLFILVCLILIIGVTLSSMRHLALLWCDRIEEDYNNYHQNVDSMATTVSQSLDRQKSTVAAYANMIDALSAKENEADVGGGFAPDTHPEIFSALREIYFNTHGCVTTGVHSSADNSSYNYKKQSETSALDDSLWSDTTRTVFSNSATPTYTVSAPIGKNRWIYVTVKAETLIDGFVNDAQKDDLYVYLSDGGRILTANTEDFSEFPTNDKQFFHEGFIRENVSDFMNGTENIPKALYEEPLPNNVSTNNVGAALPPPEDVPDVIDAIESAADETEPSEAVMPIDLTDIYDPDDGGYTTGDAYELMSEDAATDFFWSMSQSENITIGESKVWYKSDITIQNADTLTLTVGRPCTVSRSALTFAVEIIGIFSLLLFVYTIVFLILVILQGATNSKLRRIAYIDPVTSWYNWTHFNIKAAKLLKRSKNRNYAVIAVDICKFKVINDLYGHREGDRLLSAICTKLRTLLNKKELCTRYFADNFVLLLTYTTEEELAKRIAAINAALLERTHEKMLRFCFGVYPVEDKKAGTDLMVTYAVIAKDTIKDHSERSIAFFDKHIRERLIREKEIENSMEEALKNREFALYLQPKYRSDGSAVAGAEALVRWISPTRGFISPGDFIPTFEKNGFIIQLDNYMLNETCRWQRSWLDKGNTLITISVNISRVHLIDAMLVDDICRIVDSYNLPHDCIELELTESAFFDNKTVLIDTVVKLRKIGFKISMDDFGSGYSSLNSLKDLPLDIIKIDGEFFKDSGDPLRSEIIVKDTISLAKNLNMKIVAECVEKKEQVDFLNSIGCDLIQGFYFAKPMPAAEYENLVYSPKVPADNNTSDSISEEPAL